MGSDYSWVIKLPDMGTGNGPTVSSSVFSCPQLPPIHHEFSFWALKTRQRRMACWEIPCYESSTPELRGIRQGPAVLERLPPHICMFAVVPSSGAGKGRGGWISSSCDRLSIKKGWAVEAWDHHRRILHNGQLSTCEDAYPGHWHWALCFT